MSGQRGDRLPRERVHDPDKTRLKLPEPTVCPGCGAVYRKGRWTWTSTPVGANAVPCQACRRVDDAYPAGVATLRGAPVCASRLVGPGGPICAHERDQYQGRLA